MKQENMQPHSQAAALRPFSYVDTATGFIYFNLTPSDLGDQKAEYDAMLELQKTDRDQAKSRLCDLAIATLSEHYQTIFFHEWHHFLQTIFYPQRYLQSWRELDIAFYVLSELRDSEETFVIRKMDISKPFRNTIRHSSMVIGLDIVDRKLVPVLNRRPADIRHTDFTTTDLLEEATSIFEFKIEVGRESDGTSYTEWIRNRKLSGKTCYCNIFRLLSKLMGANNAYVALPALVQASFMTTWPDSTFVQLANYLLERIGEAFQPETIGCASLFLIFRRLLAEQYLGASGTPPNPNGPTEDDDFYFIDTDSYSRILSYTTPKHTVYPQASRYLQMITGDPQLETALIEPYHANIFPLLDAQLCPSLIVVRLYYGELAARDTIIIPNQYFKDTPVPISIPVTYSDYWFEIMRRKDVAYSLFTNINDKLEHYCRHRDCPYYDTNICRRWTIIPPRWQECQFPDWLGTVSGRRVDLNTNQLLRA